MPRSECYCTMETLGHSCERIDDNSRFQYDKIEINDELTIVNAYCVPKGIEECEKRLTGEYSNKVIKRLGAAVALSEAIELTGVEKKRLRKQRKLGKLALDSEINVLE